jgi:type I restriction enzyme S subunit
MLLLIVHWRGYRMIYNETRYNSHWNTKKLSELGTFARGKSKHRPRDDERLYEGGGYPLIQTGEVKAANLYITSHEQEYGEFGLAQSKLWDAGTLCITIAANIAETAILGYPMCFPDSVVGFSAFPAESSEKFMHYVFTYIRNSIQNSVAGSIQDNINIDYLSQLDFKVPPKSYQDKVVGVLGTIDEKIDTNTRICTELEAMAKTLYDYWFTQFDFPDENGKPYRSSGGEMVWNDQLKRKIPKGWSAGQLSDIANITMGQSPSGDTYNENGSGTIFYQGCTDFGTRFPVPRVYTSAPTRFAKAGDILMSVRAPVGTLNIAMEDCCIGRGLAALNSKFGSQLHLLYTLSGFKQLFDVMDGNGTTFGSITKDTLFEMKVVIPRRDQIKSFEEMVQPIEQKIRVAEQENRELTKLRDWLLPMLMNGQATVE